MTSISNGPTIISMWGEGLLPSGMGRALFRASLTPTNVKGEGGITANGYKAMTPRQQVEQHSGYDFNDSHNDCAHQRKAQDKNKPEKHTP